MTRQTILKWELERLIPDADMLMRLAKLIEVSMQDLAADEKENFTKHMDLARLEPFYTKKQKLHKNMACG